MIVKETGVLQQSNYFFFAPSDMFKEFYPCIINCGHFFCQWGYHIQRAGNHTPLLLYVIDGTFCLDYEENHYVAEKNDIILIDGEKPHEYYSGEYCEFIYMHYCGGNSIDITRHLLVQNNGPLFRLSNHKLIYRQADTLIRKLCYEQDVDDIELSCTIYDCLCQMQAFNTALSDISTANSSVIEASIRFIRENAEKKLSLNDIADHVNLSPYYFSHLFKEETGCSPVQFLSQCKINLAKTMLKTTIQSVSEISDYLGYSSSASFINAFSNRTGVSPLKFRNSIDY